MSHNICYSTSTKSLEQYRGSYGNVDVENGVATKYVSLVNDEFGENCMMFDQTMFREIVILRELSRLNVPGVSKLIDCGRTNGHLKMEKIWHKTVDGGIKLAKSVDNHSSSELYLCLIEILYRLLMTLSEFERFNVVHGDLSPCNILLDESRYNYDTGIGPIYTTIIDFGAFCFDPEIRYNQNTCTRNFSSPEMMDNTTEPVTPKHDLYSLCINILFVISGYVYLREDFFYFGLNFHRMYNNRISQEHNKIFCQSSNFTDIQWCSRCCLSIHL